MRGLRKQNCDDPVSERNNLLFCWYKQAGPAGCFPAGPSLGKRACKPNSVVCGHSSRRRVTADAHQQPTRRFRHLLEPPVAYRADTPRRLVLEAFGASLPIWSCSVWGLPCPLPYGSSGALLPHLFTLTPAGGPAVQADLNESPVAQPSRKRRKR